MITSGNYFRCNLDIPFLNFWRIADIQLAAGLSIRWKLSAPNSPGHFQKILWLTYFIELGTLNYFLIFQKKCQKSKHVKKLLPSQSEIDK